MHSRMRVGYFSRSSTLARHASMSSNVTAAYRSAWMSLVEATTSSCHAPIVLSAGNSSSMDSHVNRANTVGGLETPCLHACCTWTTDREWPPSPVKRLDVSMLSFGTLKVFAIDERIKVRCTDAETTIVSEVRAGIAAKRKKRGFEMEAK